MRHGPVLSCGRFVGKTATPKLSTANELFYVYHRDENLEASHNDWRLTAIDFRSGWPVFSIKRYFDGDGFGDNVSGILAGKTLGKDDYGRKVFNNIWGTFSFGPRNSVFISTYRGYIRFSSAPSLANPGTEDSKSAEQRRTPRRNQSVPQPPKNAMFCDNDYKRALGRFSKSA